MKKLLFFTIIILCAFNINGQSVRDLKKANKIISSMKIINKGIDFNKVFVPICNGSLSSSEEKTFQDIWSEKMLIVGLEVGSYHTEQKVKDATNREMNLKTTNVFSGDYIFSVNTIALNYTHKHIITIKDLHNNNKLVGSFSFNLLAQTSNENVLIPILEAFMNSKTKEERDFESKVKAENQAKMKQEAELKAKADYEVKMKQEAELKAKANNEVKSEPATKPSKEIKADSVQLLDITSDNMKIFDYSTLEVGDQVVFKFVGINRGIIKRVIGDGKEYVISNYEYYPWGTYDINYGELYVKNKKITGYKKSN